MQLTQGVLSLPRDLYLDLPNPIYPILLFHLLFHLHQFSCKARRRRKSKVGGVRGGGRNNSIHLPSPVSAVYKLQQCPALSREGTQLSLAERNPGLKLAAAFLLD